MSKKGFTLIELLVVIAIIGILASIVLVTFPGAQDRARDARIRSAISQMRTEMTLYGDDNNGDFSGFDCTYDNMPNLCGEVTTNGGTQVTNAVAGGVCVYSDLNTAGAGFFCADSTGMVNDYAAAPATCAGATFTCQP